MNESSSKRVIFEIIIVLVVLIVIGAIIFFRTSNNSYVSDHVPDTTSTSTPVSFSLATYESGRFGISFAYPDIFTVGKSEEETITWRHDATTTGTIATSISIPRSFEPQTNFSEASFIVGFSKASDAIATCLQKEFPSVETSAVDIGGITFTRFHYMDAGAGNFYETTSYRSIYNDRCYAVETLIHSTNVGNYSPDQHITEFNRSKVQEILDTMVESFRFR